MKVIELFRKYRRQRLNDKLDDAEYYLRKWKFGMRPSEIRKLEVKIENLKEKLRKIDRH